MDRSRVSLPSFKDVPREAWNELAQKRIFIFDLAMFESMQPDGRRAIFTKDGKEYPQLVREYTDDGGHLNDKGRRVIAEQLLILLAGLSR